MDTKSLDKQAKEHLQVYDNFMLAAKIGIVAIIATLVIMAATLI
ncbi:MAG: aa3-type cytochrome c oxidase subunit IV [Candidatus Puniceispirillaceae bacterium]